MLVSVKVTGVVDSQEKDSLDREARTMLSCGQGVRAD